MMSEKNSKFYKKGEPKRSFNNIIIVVEGTLERDYFNFFQNLNPRVSVQYVERKGDLPDVKNLIARLTAYHYRRGIENEDYVWFVLDVDKWSAEHIDELSEYCDKYDNWSIALSNYCFEVWLLYHLADEISSEYNTASKVKKALRAKMANGFSINEFPPLIREAADNAYVADPFNKDLYPSTGVSKLYNLATNLFEILGHVPINNF